jgi:hypothetical protein
MRQKKVWRYYCDHCNKGGCGKAAMIKHEASCAHNPNRKCRMCGHGELVQKPMPELIQALQDGGVPKLREVSDGCPACMLAAIIQEGEGADPEDRTWHQFDFKEEAKGFWALVNDERRSWMGG